MKFFAAAFFFFLSLLLSDCAPREDVEFVSKLYILPLEDNTVELTDKLSVRIDDKLITIPKGFKTDLASIPRIFWSIESPYDYKNMSPAVLHDFQYSCPNNLSRKKIDSIFYSALIDNRVNPIIAYIFWLAVRMGGVNHFNKDGYCGNVNKNYKEISYQTRR